MYRIPRRTLALQRGDACCGKQQAGGMVRHSQETVMIKIDDNYRTLYVLIIGVVGAVLTNAAVFSYFVSSYAS